MKAVLTYMGGRKGLLLYAAVMAALAAYDPLTNLVLSSRLILAMRNLATGASGQDLPVVETKIRRPWGSRDLEAVVYGPSRSLPKTAILLIPGVSELGCYHPRLVALARALANMGFFVLTPDIRMFRQFQVSPEALDEISFWYEHTVDTDAAEKVEHIGIVGISFSGTMALIVAARPEVRDSAAFVASIGAYQDLLRCTRRWFASGQTTVSSGYYPVRYYGRWIIMLAALDMITSEAERNALHAVLLKLLLQESAPPADLNRSPQAQRWYRLAVMREDESDPELIQAIENHLAPLYRQLSPDQAAAEIQCPVFLVHGAYDDLIPPEETQELQKQLTKIKARLLISPFLTHTHLFQETLNWRQKAAAFYRMLWFFNSFVRAAR